MAFVKLHKVLLFAVLTFALFAAGFFSFSPHHRGRTATAILSPVSWEHMTVPGELSQPHAFLENNCAACHTAGKGVEAKNCMVCHADNKDLLQRQPTAFHGNITACAACHLEHRGPVSRITRMDHAALTRIGWRQTKTESPQTVPDLAQAKRWLEQSSDAPHFSAEHLQPEEALLNCATCHQTKDRPQGFFGTNCAQCHTTAKWTIAEFRHPSSSSQSCAQCHQAPPSHYMMHFNMVSKKIAKQEDSQVAECCGPTQVDQCYRCHQTTSWNDIKGVGWYKHH